MPTLPPNHALLQILSSKLGNKLPLLLLGQAMVIAFGAPASFCSALERCAVCASIAGL